MNCLNLGIVVSGALVLATVGYGFGLERGLKKLENFKVEIAKQTTQREAENAEVLRKQTSVTHAVTKDYEDKVNTIRNTYSSRLPNRSSRNPTVPASSSAAGPTNAAASNPIFVGQCTETTQQLISLQAWIHQIQ